MKKHIFALTLMIAMPLSISAAPDGQYEHGWKHGWRHGDKIERLTKELNLTADQKTQAEAIFAAQKEKFKALHEEGQKNFSALLTKDQLAKYEQLQKEREEKWRKRRDTDGQTPPPSVK
jgi:protein CpxP